MSSAALGSSLGSGLPGGRVPGDRCVVPSEPLSADGACVTGEWAVAA